MKNILIVLALILVGCGNPFCIRVDGKYQDKTGGFEYCFDPSKGFFKNSETDEKALIVTEKELQEIKAEENQSSTSAKSIKKIDELLKRLSK